jgi:hypothetical protein
MFVVVTTVSILAVFGLCALLVCSVITGSGERVESTQRRLIYATNPSLLMDACRQLVAANPAADGPTSVDPNSTSLPAIIHRVNPRMIAVDHGQVTLECGTNVYRFGLWVNTMVPATPMAMPMGTTMPSTVPTSQPSPPMATKLLAPGVWYYAEDGAMPNP